MLYIKDNQKLYTNYSTYLPDKNRPAKTFQSNILANNSLVSNNFPAAIGTTFQGHFLTRTSSNAEKLQILSDIRAGKYKSRGILATDVQYIERTLRPDNLDAFKQIADSNKPIPEKGSDCFRFSVSDIDYALRVVNKLNKQFLTTLLSAKNLDNDNFRFDGETIGYILKSINKENKAYVNTVLKAKDNTEQEYKLKPLYITDVLSGLNRKTAPIILSLLSNPKLSGSSISIAAQAIAEGDRDKVFNLLIQHQDKFETPENFSRVLECVNNDNLDLLKTLFNPAGKYKNKPAFSEKEITAYSRLIKYNVFDYLKRILDFVDAGRFSSTDATQIVSELNDFFIPDNDARFLKTIMEAKTIDNKQYRFSVSDLRILSFVLSSNKTDILNLLLHTKDDFTGNFRISDNEIFKEIVTHANNQNIEGLSYLLNLKEEDNSKYKFTQKQIYGLLELVKANAPIEKILKGEKPENLNQREIINLLRFYRNVTNRKAIGVETISLEDLKAALNNKEFPLLKYDNDGIKNLKTSLARQLSIYLFDRVENNSFKANNEKFHRALENIDQGLEDFNIDENLKHTEGLTLRFKVSAFITQIRNEMTFLSDKDKKLALEYFGFSFNKNAIEGYPFIRTNKEVTLYKLKHKADHPIALESVIQKMEGIVKEFTENNGILLPQNPQLEKDLNDLFGSFPEFYTNIGKKQHKTHYYTVDLHELKTLQEFINDPEYEKLPAYDKKIAKLAVMFHDIAKRYNEIDLDHPKNSSKVVYQMLKNTNLTPAEIDRVCGLVRNHHWVQNLANSKSPQELERNLNYVAFEYRKPYDFDIAKIFARADLASIGNDECLNKFKNSFLSYVGPIEERIKSIHSTGIFLPHTRIPEASKINLEPVEISDLEGLKTTNTVIYLHKIKDWQELGFEKNTGLTNFSALVHFVDKNNKEITQDIDFASLEGKEGIFSCSYINPYKSESYHSNNIGFAFDVDTNNIGLASSINFATGYNKNLDNFIKYLYGEFSGDINTRITISEKIKKVLKSNPQITRMSYEELFKSLAQSQAITDISDPKIRQMIESVVDAEMLNNSANNEVIVYAPKPTAIVTKVPVDQIPYHFRKYAETHDLPIVVL